MPDGLYERDVLSWAEHQADLLRRLAAGERLNESVDWTNVIEEVQDVGLSELRSCRSMLRNAIEHMLKIHAWPENQATGHWASETRTFLTEARDRFTPSMRQRIDVDDLYADALFRVLPREEEFGPAHPIPKACPFALNDLLVRHPDLTALLALLPERARLIPDGLYERDFLA